MLLFIQNFGVQEDVFIICLAILLYFFNLSAGMVIKDWGLLFYGQLWRYMPVAKFFAVGKLH